MTEHRYITLYTPVIYLKCHTSSIIGHLVFQLSHEVGFVIDVYIRYIQECYDMGNFLGFQKHTYRHERSV